MKGRSPCCAIASSQCSCRDWKCCDYLRALLPATWMLGWTATAPEFRCSSTGNCHAVGVLGHLKAAFFIKSVVELKPAKRAPHIDLKYVDSYPERSQINAVWTTSTRPPRLYLDSLLLARATHAATSLSVLSVPNLTKIPSKPDSQCAVAPTTCTLGNGRH